MDLLKLNYSYINAWKLYENKGIINNNVIREKIGVSWARCKVYKVDQHTKKIDTPKAVHNSHLNWLSTLNLGLKAKSLFKDCLYFVTDSNYNVILKNELSAIDADISHSPIAGIEINDVLHEYYLGTNSISLSHISGENEYCFGGEHFLYIIQDVFDYTIPFEVAGLQFYFTIFKPVYSFDNQLFDKINFHFEELLKYIQRGNVSEVVIAPDQNSVDQSDNNVDSRGSIEISARILNIEEVLKDQNLELSLLAKGYTKVNNVEVYVKEHVNKKEILIYARPDNTPILESTVKTEKQIIQDAIIKCKYHISDAAKLLGISRATLYRKIKLYEIE